MKHVILLSAPYANVLFAPQAALPSLVGHLKKNGHLVEQFDLNIEHFNNFLQGYTVHCLDGVTLSVSKFRELFYELDLDTLNTLFLEIRNAYFDTVFKNKNEVNLSFGMGWEDINIHQLLDNLKDKDALTNTLLNSGAYHYLKEKPPLIGFSISHSRQFAATLFYCKIIKESLNTKIVLGGIYASYLVYFLNENQLRDLFEYCDCIAFKEGETALNLLTEFYLNGSGCLENIPNLCYLSDSGSIVKHTSHHLENVEELAAPDFTDINFDLYLSPERMIPYQASRGCYWGKCAFCDTNKDDRTNYRKKSPKKVIDDLVSIRDASYYSHIHFTDYAIEPNHFTEIVDEMDKCENFNNVKWSCLLRLSSHFNNDNLISKARKNGCELIDVGIETFNVRLLKMIKKGINVKDIEGNLQIFKKNNIKTLVHMLVGLPSQTADDIRKDMEELIRLSDLIDWVDLARFSLSKPTDMYSEPEKYNIICINEKNQEFTHHQDGEKINYSEIKDIEMNEYRPLIDKVFNTNQLLIAYLKDIGTKGGKI